MKKLQRVERTKFYDVPVHCCYCGQQILALPPTKEPIINPCKHTLFIAHDLEYQFLADRVIDQLRSRGFIVDIAEDGYIEVNSPAEDDDDDSIMSPESVTDSLEFDDGLKIAAYVGPPSFYGTYVGIAPIDNEDE